MNPNNVLLKTSAATDVLESGNKVTITGLNPIAKNSIVDMKQFKYHAETVQVLTIGTNTETITAGVRYVIKMDNLNVRKGGYTQNELTFAYVATAADVSGTQAAAREIVNLALIAQINAQTSTNFMTAATSTGGAGFTVTDSAGYYPPRLGNVTSGRKGASLLVFGGGFTSASTVTVTTPAVYQFGDGTWLSQNATVFSPYFQNYVSGSYTNPKTVDGADPVAGQFYDAFAITSTVMQPNSVGMMDQLVITPQSQIVFVDNGTGASTTNAAGFLTFQRAMLRLMCSALPRSAKNMHSFFDSIPHYATLTGLSVIPTTALAENGIDVGEGQNFSFTPSVVATTAANAMPIIDSTNGGLNLANDAASGKSLELSAPLSGFSGKEYVVGKEEFSIYARIYVDDVSGVNPMIVGFRKKAAYVAAIASNDSYVGIGIVGTSATQAIKTQSIVATNASTPVDSGKTWADGATHELEVRVDITGVASYYVDGQLVAPPATYNTLTAGMIVIPFISELQTADVAANVSVRELISLPTKSWRI